MRGLRGFDIWCISRSPAASLRCSSSSASADSAQPRRQSERQAHRHGAAVPLERNKWPAIARRQHVLLDGGFESIVVGAHNPARIRCGFEKLRRHRIARQPQLHRTVIDGKATHRTSVDGSVAYLCAPSFCRLTLLLVSKSRCKTCATATSIGAAVRRGRGSCITVTPVGCDLPLDVGEFVTDILFNTALLLSWIAGLQNDLPNDDREDSGAVVDHGCESQKYLAARSRGIWVETLPQHSGPTHRAIEMGSVSALPQRKQLGESIMPSVSVKTRQQGALDQAPPKLDEASRWAAFTAPCTRGFPRPFRLSLFTEQAEANPPVGMRVSA